MAAIIFVAVCCALALIPRCTFGDEIQQSSDITTNERLAKVEAVLERVLVTNAVLERKNLELEQRIVALEQGNRRLNVDHDSTHTVEGTAGEAEKYNDNTKEAERSGTKDEPVEKPRIRNIRKRAIGNTPRALLSGSDTVAFTAIISKVRIENLGAGQTVKYDKVITNEGGAYHATTGIFTAPVSGVYVFNIDTMLEPGDYQYLTLMRDGQSISSNYVHGSRDTHFKSTSSITTLRVNAGSEVWVSTIDYAWHGNGTIHGNRLSSFSGWLVGHPNDV